MQNFSLLKAIFLSGLLLSACDQAPSESKSRKTKPHLVQTERLILEKSELIRNFNALIIAPNTINISNQIAGTIKKLPFRAGSLVKKGEILVQLDDSLTQAEYEKALANKEQADQDLERIKKLIPRQLASAEELSAAITEQKIAQAEATLKSIQLERSLIKAPFAGVISERYYEPGDTVSINSQLLTLVDNENLIVKSAVPESLISSISIGSDVKIQIPALSRELDGQISTIYPTVDANTQQITIEVSFNKKQNTLYPGQFAELVINRLMPESILIPVNAVQYDTNGAWVYSVDEKNIAHQTRITTGLNINNKIVVKSGLIAGDTIITRGFVGLQSGKKVSTTDSIIKKNHNESN